MSHHNANDNEIRSAAQSLYDNIGSINYRGGYHRSGFDYSRPHSINLITEEFLGGYMQDGRMSVVRRFFCLFVTFDLFFVSLLWLICIMITGDNIYNALLTQVVHYSVYKSLFDVVMAAICRFVTLLLFYAFLSVNHWLIIALSTSGSCLFLISKVFVFDWLASPQPVFQVVLILTSFVLAFGEAWFFDCRVIPQERHARSYFTAITSMQTANERSPLLAPFLASEGERPGTESIANFYSPFETNHHSDEEEEQDDEYRKMGIECVRKAYDLLQTDDWKIEKVTKKGDTIQSVQRDKLGKVYRLTGRVKYAAKPLLEELFYKIEEVPKWNPTLLESKIVRKIDSKTDISYQATVGSGGGLVKARDFVNLRSWRLCKNGKIIVDSDDEDESDCKIEEDDDSCVGSVSTISTDNDFLSSDDAIARSINSAKVSHTEGFKTLSKSLGAKDFQSHIVNNHPPPLVYGDANTLPEMSTNKLLKKIDRMYVSAAISVEYPSVPINPKYTRGQNLVSCWALREIDGQKDACIFEWLLCLDLKGYIPKYVLDNSYTTVMQDYMTYLRKYCNEMRQKRKRSSTKQQ